MMFNATF